MYTTPLYIKSTQIIQCANPVLCCTSLVYITNATTCYLMGEYLYSKMFITLVATSLIIHSHPNFYTNIIDKIPIFGIVSYGGYKYIQNLPKCDNILYKILPLITFMATIYLYTYGWIYNKYCYHPDTKWATRSHAFLHVISSIGHHSILLLL